MNRKIIATLAAGCALLVVTGCSTTKAEPAATVTRTVSAAPSASTPAATPSATGSVGDADQDQSGDAPSTATQKFGTSFNVGKMKVTVSKPKVTPVTAEDREVGTVDQKNQVTFDTFTVTVTNGEKDLNFIPEDGDAGPASITWHATVGNYDSNGVVADQQPPNQVKPGQTESWQMVYGAGKNGALTLTASGADQELESGTVPGELFATYSSES